MKWIIGVLAGLLAVLIMQPVGAIAQEKKEEEKEEKPFVLPPVKVTAPAVTIRAEMERDIKETKSTTTVTGQQLRSFNTVNAFDALRIVPGLNFEVGTRTGNPGALRGTSQFTIPKIIDDFPSIRQSGTGSEIPAAGFSNLGVTIPSIAIESVEVVKGSQGVLYGEATEGGVIITRLKRGRPGPPTGSLYAEPNTSPETLFMGDIGGGSKSFDYYFAAKRFDLHDEGETVNSRRTTDGDQFSGLGKLGWNPIKNMRIELLAVGNKDQADLLRFGQLRERDVSNLFIGFKVDQRLTDRAGYQVGYTFWKEDQDTKERNLTSLQITRLTDRESQNHIPFGSIYYKTWISDTWNHTASGAVCSRNRTKVSPSTISTPITSSSSATNRASS